MWAVVGADEPRRALAVAVRQFSLRRCCGSSRVMSEFLVVEELTLTLENSFRGESQPGVCVRPAFTFVGCLMVFV